MAQLLESAPLFLDESLPQLVHVLYHPESNRYVCYCHADEHGLAGFLSEIAAREFAESMGDLRLELLTLPFESAREVAKERPLPVIALMILDHAGGIFTHYVR